MTGPKGSSEFCFPETPSVPRGEAKGNIEVEGPVINREKCEEIICLAPAD